MRENELLLSYGDGGVNGGFQLRTYDSVVDFTHRDMFEHKHSDMEISLIIGGRGLYHLKNGVCDIEAGDVFLFGSSQVHCITDVHPGETMRLFNIQMEPRLFWASGAAPLNERHLKLFADRCERLPVSTPLAVEMTQSILALRGETIARAPGYRIRIYAHLMTLIGQLVQQSGQSFDEEDSPMRKADYACMRRAMLYIDEHLTETLTLGEIAETAGYSRNYFSTLFTALNGLSPWEYITIKRIAQAKHWLLTTKLPMTEIASRCGYENLSNFNRQFRRLTGCTPTEYSERNNRNIVSANKNI